MPQFTAVVHDADGVRFVAAAHSQHELEEQVIDYIRERCDYVLWPCAATSVRELIARDRKYAAIAAYFANVGQRWDPERLELLDGAVLRADFSELSCGETAELCNEALSFAKLPKLDVAGSSPVARSRHTIELSLDDETAPNAPVRWAS